MPHSSHNDLQQPLASSSQDLCGHVGTVRAIVRCTCCGHTFTARKGRYYWCKCGEPLTDGDELSPVIAVDSGLPERSRRFSPSAPAGAGTARSPVMFDLVHGS